MKVSWNDLMNGSPNEIKKTFKLNDRQFEQQVRGHMDGANPQERRDLYKKVWDKR